MKSKNETLNFEYFRTKAEAMLLTRGWQIHIFAYYDNYHRILRKVATDCWLRDIFAKISFVSITKEDNDYVRNA